MSFDPITPIPPPEGDEEFYHTNGFWIFWYLIPNRSGNISDWSVYLHPLHSFDTTNDFLRLLNSIEHPSKLLKGCRFYIFRSFSKPLWEDKTVSNGHIISVEIDKNNISANDITSKWIDVVSDLIDDTTAENLTVLGAEYHSKPDSWKIALWVSQACEDLEIIRSRMEKITGIEPARISEIIAENE